MVTLGLVFVNKVLVTLWTLDNARLPLQALPLLGNLVRCVLDTLPEAQLGPDYSEFSLRDLLREVRSKAQYSQEGAWDRRACHAQHMDAATC